MPGVVVDGQDVDRVAEAMAQAVQRARRGEGPSLLEMKTYRYSGHSRSDPASYRPAGELDTWLKRDPINIFADRLIAEKVLSPRGLEQIQAETNEAIEQVVAEVLDSPTPDLKQIFAHVSGESLGGDQRWRFWGS
jgi:pyruvate dehydrogenase E1 component alpha subunit